MRPRRPKLAGMPSSAQRLSASQRWAYARHADRRCDHGVLNAFRHHRGGHSSAQRACCSLGTVLNAFRHHRGGHPEHGMRHDDADECAQRLSASQRWASRQLEATQASPVMCSTPFGITEVGMRCLSRSSAMHRQCSTPFGITEVGIAEHARRPVALHECSTPFGITEVGIRAARRTRRAQLRVLNAFRHHRGGHRDAIWRAGIRLSMCSTPFGITEVGIRRVPPTARLDRRCSTPFGITEVGMMSRPVWRSAVHSGAQRLSASQRWASAASSGCRTSHYDCAQRLSASQRWAWTFWRGS